MKNKKNNKKKGFTLIEILVAVLIIGVLAAIALPSYMRSVERSRATGPMTNLGSIAKAQKSYRMGTEHYTDNVANLDISLTDASNGEDATGNTFESEYFSYKVYGDDKAVAIATRKNVDEDKKYELSVNYATGQIYCRPIENKTCIDLGLDEGMDYSQVPWGTCQTSGSQISCYTRENEGRTETMICIDNFLLKQCQFVSEGNDGTKIIASCRLADMVDGFCPAYDRMGENDNNNGLTRSCLELEGTECKTWGSWGPIADTK